MIAERVSHHDEVIPPSKIRKSLGRYNRKGDAKNRFCHGRRIRKRGYQPHPWVITSLFGRLKQSLLVAECCVCGARYSPLLDALKIASYSRKESNCQHEFIEAVMDTNYRRLIDGRSVDISQGAIHNMVVKSDIDRLEEQSVDLGDLFAIMADGTGYQRQKGKKGGLRSVIGITAEGNVEPLGTFANTSLPKPFAA